MKSRLFLTLFLPSLIFALPLPQGVNGEFLIDTSIVYGSAPYNQYSPSIAFDGTNYLVVWEDRRSGSFEDIDIYGARVNQAGQVLDSASIPISTAVRDQAFPSIAFDGTNYLVVWQDYRSGYSYDIYGARVSRTGQVLDPAGIPISTVAYRQEHPSVAFDGTNYLVVWTDERSGSYYYDIYGARVSRTGQVLDPDGIPISTAAAWEVSPSVAFDGTNYLVVWTDRRNGSYSDIYGARVNQAGQVLDTTGIPISTADYGKYFPSVAFDGTNYLVVWEDYRSGSSFDIYGARVSQAGVVLDPEGIPISAAARDQWSPSVAFDGTNYLVVWQDQRSGYDSSDIYGARVSQAGTVLDPAGIPISTADDDQYSPSIAFDGTNYLVVWTDRRNGSYSDISGARVSRTGRVLDPDGILISTAAYEQEYPSVTFDGTNYLVVWTDERSGSSDIYGARVNQGGQVLDPAGIPISTADDDQYSPSIAFDGTNYLVVWIDRRNGSYSDIYGARVSRTGQVLDPAGIPISTAGDWQVSPSVAFDGTNYLVVWTDRRNGSYSDIYGARVSRTGQVLDPAGIPISTAGYDQESPSIAFDGTNYLAVWTDYRSGFPNLDIYGARVNQAGQVLDPDGVPISTADDYQGLPSIAFDGTNYLVVWEDQRSGPSDIYGARVNQGGQVLDSTGIPISTAANWQWFPSVAFDGTNYLVVWQDYRTGYFDIYGARVSQAGIVIDSFPVSLQLGNQLTPKLARGIGNQLLIVYSGWVDSIARRPARTTRIWGKFYPFVGIEEDSPLYAKRSRFEIYPNPARAYLNIRLPESLNNQTLRIFDVTGKLIRVEELNGSKVKEFKVCLEGMKPGVYILQLGRTTKKFLVTR